MKNDESKHYYGLFGVLPLPLGVSGIQYSNSRICGIFSCKVIVDYGNKENKGDLK